MKRFAPDVVFLDLDMPALNGAATGVFLRRFEARRTAIVIFSSRPRAELEATAEQVDAAAVVEKGATEEQIRTVVEMIAADRELRGRGVAPRES